VVRVRMDVVLQPRPPIQPFTYDRLDTPHHTSDHDPWRSDKLFPDVFARRAWFRWLVGFFPTPGFGSYLPHLFLPLAAEFFFRSWPYVIFGVILWSFLVEMPIFLALYWYDLAPVHQRLWRTVKVFEVKKPTDKQIQKALKLKAQYEHPEQHEYYAVWVTTKNKTGEDVSAIPEFTEFTEKETMTSQKGMEETRVGVTAHSEFLGGMPRPYQIFGYWYIRLDITWYVLFSIFIDIILGIVGTMSAFYVIRSFDIAPFSTVVDWTLVCQFTILFFIVAHVSDYWSWISTLIASGYILVIRFWSAATADGISVSTIEDWTPNLVLSGITLFYWFVFFRNPFPWAGWMKQKRIKQEEDFWTMRQKMGNMGRYDLNLNVLIPQDDSVQNDDISSQPMMEVYQGKYYPYGGTGPFGDQSESKKMREQAKERMRAMRTTDPSLFYPKEFLEGYTGITGYSPYQNFPVEQNPETESYLRRRKDGFGVEGNQHRAFTVHYKAYQDRMQRISKESGMGANRGGIAKTNAVFSWWRFSSMNYDTYGYNAIFGTVILFNVVAITALAIG